jgi:hypothetical protein
MKFNAAFVKFSGKFVGDTQCEKHPIEVCGAGCLFKEGEEECHDKVGLPKNIQLGEKCFSVVVAKLQQLFVTSGQRT